MEKKLKMKIENEIDELKKNEEKFSFPSENLFPTNDPINIPPQFKKCTDYSCLII